MRLGIDWSVTRHSILYGAERLGEVGLDLGQRRRQVAAVEDDALEEAAAGGVVGVLVERDDVALVAGHEGGHRRDESRLIRAVDDQAGVIAVRLGVQCHVESLRGRGCRGGIA